MTSEQALPPRPRATAPRPPRVLMVAIRYPEVEGGVDAMVRDLIAALGIDSPGIDAPGIDAPGIDAPGTSALEPRAEIEVFVPGDWSERTLVTTRHGAVPRHSLRLRMPIDRRRPLAGLIGFLVEFPATLRALVRLLREGRFDLVHLHTVTNLAAWFRLAASLAGVPYLVTLHGSDVTAFESRRAEERLLIRWALSGAAAVVAVSGALAAAAQARFALAAAPEVIRNGIDLDLAAPARGDEGAPAAPGAAAAGGGPAAGGPAGRGYVLSAGALDHVKGHDLLVRAWAALAPQFPGTRLVIAGEGDEGAGLRRLAAGLGCAERIEFAGALPRPAVLALMRGAALFVLPSRQEGLGIVLLEAGAAGCPVVAADVGGVGEIVTAEETGILVPPEDPAALAEAIGRALGDAGLRARLGAALRARVGAEFSSTAMAEGYLEVYRRVAGGGRP